MAHQGGLPKLVAVGAKPPSEGDDVSNQPLSAVAAGSSSNPGVVKPVSFIAEVESLEGYVDVPMLPPGATSLPKPLLLDEAIPSDNDDDEFTGDDPCPTTDAEDTNAGADEQRIRRVTIFVSCSFLTIAGLFRPCISFLVYDFLPQKEETFRV